MTVQDLCQRYGVSKRTINGWVRDYGMPPPVGNTKNARYGLIHIEWIEAHRALQHTKTHTKEAMAYCQEVGITLGQYVAIREQAFRDFGLAAA